MVMLVLAGVLHNGAAGDVGSAAPPQVPVNEQAPAAIQHNFYHPKKKAKICVLLIWIRPYNNKKQLTVVGCKPAKSKKLIKKLYSHSVN